MVLAWCGRDGARLHGQTRIRPAQIRSWRQVQPPGIRSSGTQLRLDQLAMPAGILGFWRDAVAAGQYDHFRVAFSDQADPILIVCIRPETDPLGPGCVGGLFWFTLPRQ